MSWSVESLAGLGPGPVRVGRWRGAGGGGRGRAVIGGAPAGAAP